MNSLNSKVAGRCLFFMFLGVCLSSSQTLAYIPPANFIIKTISKKRDGFKNIRIRSSISKLNNVGEPLVKVQVLTWVDYSRSLMRFRVSSEQGVELFAREKKLNSNDLTLANLLFDPQAGRLEEYLRAVGVAMPTAEHLKSLPDEPARRLAEFSCFSRHNRQPVWVLGVKSKDDSGPQLWIQKDGFLTQRAFLKTKKGFWEYRLENYRFSGEFPYPRMIQVSEPKLKEILPAIYQEDTGEVAVNVDPSELRSKLISGWTVAGEDAEGSVKSLIEEIENHFR